ERVFEQAGRFDLVHFHCDYLHFPFSWRAGYAHVTTLHGRLDLPELQPLYQHFPGVPLVSISDAQRAPLPGVNWQATGYHGLPPTLHTLRDHPGKYLAFLGRISPEKRVERAIHIAQRVGRPLKIAAKVDANDSAYYETEIRPLLRAAGPLVEFIGEVGGK